MFLRNCGQCSIICRYLQWGDRLLNEKQLKIIDECFARGNDVELQHRRDGIYIIESKKKVHKTAGVIPDRKLNNSPSNE